MDIKKPVEEMKAEAVSPPNRVQRRVPQLARWGLVILAFALLAGGGYYAWQTWFSQDNPADSLITADAQLGDLEDTVTATGTLQPKDYVDVGTQVSGQLKKIHVLVGAVVTAKQLLAEIDPSVYQSKVDGDNAQLLNLKAQLADKEAQLVLANLQSTRQTNLDREEATTTDAVQIAAATQKSALAQTDAVRAQIKQTGSTLRGDEANLGYTKIYAPIAGTVVSQTAKQGQTLNANQAAPIVMRIADLATMTVQSQVSEADVSKLKIGMDVYFTTLGGNSRRHYGKLRQIPPTPTVVNNVVLYDALFDVENPDQALMTQMTAQVFFVASSAKDAVLVPIAALHPAVKASNAPGATGTGSSRKAASGGDPRSQYADGRALVSVVDAEGRVTEREVKVGVMNRISAQIVSGLEVGEKVVIGSKANAANASTTPAQASNSLVPSATRAGGR